MANCSTGRTTFTGEFEFDDGNDFDVVGNYLEKHGSNFNFKTNLLRKDPLCLDQAANGSKRLTAPSHTSLK